MISQRPPHFLRGYKRNPFKDWNDADCINLGTLGKVNSTAAQTSKLRHQNESKENASKKPFVRGACNDKENVFPKGSSLGGNEQSLAFVVDTAASLKSVASINENEIVTLQPASNIFHGLDGNMQFQEIGAA